MDLLIDNKDFKSGYGITVLDYTGALSFPATREDGITWADKSGIDPNLENVRYDAKEFIMSFIVEAEDSITAYSLVNNLLQYMRAKRVFVLSLRDTSSGMRESMICERSGTIIPEINIRQQNSLYAFKIGFKDINPSAVRYQTEIIGNAVSIIYDKGQNAVLYWGDGTRQEVSNSGEYSKTDYDANGLVDVFIDIDEDSVPVTSLTADFSGTPESGEAGMDVQFTDTSIGTPIIWSWNFGDGGSSSEQNPSHRYTTGGVYTVTLQVFNSAGGTSTITKTDYITTAELLADFSGTPLTGPFNLDVQFTDLSIGNPTSYEWDFGDGTSSSLKNPLKTYSIVGAYAVSLKVTNASGGESIKQIADYVQVGLPDFDANISPYTCTAMVSAPFTFVLSPPTSPVAVLSGAIRCSVILNGAITNYDFPAGTWSTAMGISHEFADISSMSYFEFKITLLDSGAAFSPTYIYSKGTLEMEGAGASRFSMWGAPTDITVWVLSLLNNSIPVGDINTLLEDYRDTQQSPPGQGYITFNISGGSNAIPTSTEALVVKGHLQAASLYYDNE